MGAEVVEYIRVLRVLEYIGPRKWVEDGLAQRAVKGELRFAGATAGGAVIREALLGEFPEIMKMVDKPA